MLNTGLTLYIFHYHFVKNKWSKDVLSLLHSLYLHIPQDWIHSLNGYSHRSTVPKQAPEVELSYFSPPCIFAVLIASSKHVNMLLSVHAYIVDHCYGFFCIKKNLNQGWNADVVQYYSTSFKNVCIFSTKLWQNYGVFSIQIYISKFQPLFSTLLLFTNYNPDTDL